MNILIIDTATEACSVALEFAGKTYSRFEICPQQHSQRILPMVDEVLQEANTSLSELDYLGFGRGPGSFTGVRIATGVIQGLALGVNLKVVGISTLAAMAQQAMQDSQANGVFAATDARMEEVYFGHYHLEQGIATLYGEEQVLPPEQASASITKAADSVGVGTGWQAYPLLTSNSDVTVNESILYPNALYMLPLAKAKIANDEAVEVEAIQPVYLRDKVTWKKLPGRE